jgi:hypothetical protein
MPSHQQLEPSLTDFDFISSAAGNAFFSGVGFDMMWECVNHAKDGESVDANVKAAIAAKEKIDDMVST